MSRCLVSLSCALALGLSPAALADDAPAADPAETSDVLSLVYNGYIAGLRVMKATVDAEINHADYATQAVFRTAGVARWFEKAEIHAGADGAIDDVALRPLGYQHRNLASSKNRIIRIDFTEDDAVATVTPPFGSDGEPPTTQADRVGSFDPITSVLHIMRDGGDTPCGRTVPVFDGKQRYNLRLEADRVDQVRMRGYEGEALRCRLFYEPVSGFDPEDLAPPEVYERPIYLWLAEIDEGLWAPVRFRGRMSGVRLSVEARHIEHAVVPAPDRG